MSLAAGTRLGPYEIVALIGAGGMGEVYRARDTSLQRDVAIKVLPDLFANDTERLARFTREAQTLAALNHPNIAHIHGFEQSAGMRALVMELVEGEDLAQRLTSGAIPLEEAALIAAQVAQALEAAHDQGIIHRDLKPANIKVRPDGTVKVLDFGLAKALGPEPSGPESAHFSRSPTITTPAMTAIGMILGTAAYMSPEQARGRAADKRSDLWAFGCVLYETLTGAGAFGGEDVSETLANVLKSEPDWTLLPEATPRAIRTLLRRCLTKDPKRRLDSAAAARLDIEDAVAAADVEEQKPARRVSWRAAVAASLAAIAIALLAGYTTWTLKPHSTLPVTRFTVPLADGDLGNPSWHVVALSPDGARLAYVTTGGLFLRTSDRLDVVLLRGTTVRVRSPFFSPDGEWIGFYDQGQIRKLSVGGGAPVTLAAMTSPPVGVSWQADNTILIGQGPAGIWRLSGNGGTPEQIIKVGEGERAEGPQLLPDGRTVLFSLARPHRGASQIVAQSLDTGTRTVITAGWDGRYLPTGHILYALRAALYAVPFDAASLLLTGGPVSLEEGLWGRPTITDVAQFAVSAGGTLAYVPEFGASTTASRTLVWVDRQGREDAIAAPPRPYVYARLAPGGRRVALDVADDNRDIWVWNFARGTLDRITSDAGLDRAPVWMPDGDRIIFSSERSGNVPNLYWQMADGSATAEQLTDGFNAIYATTVSPDGRYVVARQIVDGGTPDLQLIDLSERRARASGAPPLVEPRPLVQTAFSEFNGEISPDGRWLAFQSDRSGRVEVYVQPFPGIAGGQWPVSTTGGTEPLWASDGRELFYRALDGAVMRVSMTPASGLPGTPVRVIGSPAFALGGRGELALFPYRTYDVSPDGRRFLMIKTSDRPQPVIPARIIVVQNWFEELRRRVPTN